MEDHGWARWSGMQLMQLGNNWKTVTVGGRHLGEKWTLWGQAENKLEDNGRHLGKHVWNKLGDTYHHLPPARQTRDKWMTSGTQRSETQVGNNWQVEGTWRRLDATPRLLEIEAIVSVGNHVFESNNQLCINPIVCLLEACLQDRQQLGLSTFVHFLHSRHPHLKWNWNGRQCSLHYWMEMGNQFKKSAWTRIDQIMPDSCSR